MLTSPEVYIEDEDPINPPTHDFVAVNNTTMFGVPPGAGVRLRISGGERGQLYTYVCLADLPDGSRIGIKGLLSVE
jgi:hypothetical protein